MILNRWLYWNDNMRLEKMSMDGNNKTDLFTFEGYHHSIIAFTLDCQAQQLYWVGVDMDQSYTTFVSINRSNVDGTNMETIFILNQDDYYYYFGYYGEIHLSLFEQQLFVSSSTDYEISILDINQENITTSSMIIDRSLLCNSFYRRYLTIISENKQLQGM